MRILLVCNYKPGVGGISGQVELLQQKLRADGIEAEVFSTKASVWKRLWMKFQLKKIAKDFDIVHIHCCSGWGFLPAVLGVSVGRELGKRVALTYHGGGGERFFDSHPRLVRHYLSQTDTNIVLSGFLASVFDKHRLQYSIIPNMIEIEDAHYRHRKDLKPCYICTRAHEPLYNIPCILRAFQIVLAQLPEASLTLVGGGSQHEALKKMADELKLANVNFTGKVDNKEIYRYLDRTDVFLSAPKVDNMPVSIIEAMNAGLLVISSRVGGVPYMLDDGKNGLLFTSDHDKELAEQMLWAVQHQEAAKAIIENARQSVRQYQWENIKQKLYSVYGILA